MALNTDVARWAYGGEAAAERSEERLVDWGRVGLVALTAAVSAAVLYVPYLLLWS